MIEHSFLEKRIIIILFSIFIPVFIFLSFEFVYDNSCVLPALFSLPVVLYVFFLLVLTKNSNHLFIFPTLLLTWVYFLMPYLLEQKVYHPYRVIPDIQLPSMAIFCCIAIYCIYAGYYFSFRKKKIKPLTAVSYRLSNKQLTFLIKLFIGLGLFFRICDKAFPQFFDLLGNSVQLLFYAPTIVVSLLVMYFIRKGGSISLKYITIIYLIAEFFFRIAETLYFEVALLFIGGFIVYFLERKKIPFKTLFLFIIISIPLFITRFDHRYNVVLDRWYGNDNNNFIETVTEGLDLFGKTISNLEIESFTTFDKENRGASINRFENVSYLAHCIYMHSNAGKKFMYGETFYWLPIAPIPRFLIPFKPKNILSTKVAYEYGLKGNSRGSMNFPILCESYINFGFYGIIIIAFFQGLFLKWSYYKVGGISGDINILIFLNIVKQLITVESNITLVFGAILQVFLFWYLLIRFVLPKNVLTSNTKLGA